MGQIEIINWKIYAFGIEIESRYWIAKEIVSMIKCCEEFSNENIFLNVDKISHDGKSEVCLIDINTENEEIKNKILSVAKKFLLFPVFLN